MRGAGSRCVSWRTSAATSTSWIGSRRTRARCRCPRRSPRMLASQTEVWPTAWVRLQPDSSFLLRRHFLCVGTHELFCEQRRQAFLAALVQHLVELHVQVPVLHLVGGAEQRAALQAAVEAFLQLARLDTVHQLVDGRLYRADQR